MARVFTTTFQFKGQNHAAVVAITGKLPKCEHVSVKLLDTDLYPILPEGTLEFSMNDSQPTHLNNNHLAVQLFTTLKATVVAHLSKTKITGA